MSIFMTREMSEYTQLSCAHDLALHKDGDRLQCQFPWENLLSLAFLFMKEINKQEKINSGCIKDPSIKPVQ